jgi:hypothetical protein
MTIQKRITLAIIGACTFVLIMASCSDAVETDSTEAENATDLGSIVISYSIAEALQSKTADHDDASDYSYEASNVTDVSLNGDNIIVTPDAGTISGTTFTITAGGTYRIHGKLDNGGIVVNAEEQLVRLVFDGTEITNLTTSPINIVAAAKTIILLEEGTFNKIIDATTYTFESADADEPNAAIFSKSNLTIGGTGELTVTGRYQDGIRSKDGLIISGGSIIVNAVDDAITGKDYAIVKDGSLSVEAGGDGIKSDNDESTDVGFVLIEGGLLTVNAQGDGIQAETDLLISGGTFNVTSGGGSSHAVSGDTSAKGLKAVANLLVENGNITISSADDAMHSNNNLAVSGGTILISSGDDGIHADTNIGINGGMISIAKSYEGIESSNIAISDGDIHVVASDDGLNGAGGNDGSGFGGPYSGSSDYFIYLNGGYLYVDAKGDGIDVNGSIVMTGGTVIVSGPTSNGNGALDYDQSFKITGGTLLAAGSSGMAQAPGTSSTQRSVMVTLSSAKSGGTMLHLEDNVGNPMFTFQPAKQFQTIVFSSPELSTGSYKLLVGGSSSGTATDGLYEGGTYSGGTLTSTFSISAITTVVR